MTKQKVTLGIIQLVYPLVITPITFRKDGTEYNLSLVVLTSGQCVLRDVGGFYGEHELANIGISAEEVQAEIHTILQKHFPVAKKELVKIQREKRKLKETVQTLERILNQETAKE